MNKKYAIGFAALIVCLVAVSSAYAFGGMQGNEAAKTALKNKDFEAFKEARASEMTEERFAHMAEGAESMVSIKQALEEGNYEEWVEAIESKPKITDKITEENFEAFAAMHKARQEGDFETAKEIAEELGLDQFRQGPQNRPRFGRGKEMRPYNRLQESIEDGS